MEIFFALFVYYYYNDYYEEIMISFDSQDGVGDGVVVGIGAPVATIIIIYNTQWCYD